MFRLIKAILKSGSNYYVSVFRHVRINSKRCLLASLCHPVRLSARSSLASPARIFMKFGIGNLSEKSVEICEICLKSYKNVGNFTWRPKYICIVDISTKYFAAQRQAILAFPWQHPAVPYYWQLLVGQQNYKREALLRSGGNNCSADVLHWCFFSVSVFYVINWKGLQ